LIKETTPAVINISRFWPREKTKAAKMENQIHGQETKKRSQLLTDIYHNIARMQNERWLNWQGTALIDEIGKDNSFVARNYTYKPVILKGNYSLGETVQVRIKKATSFDLRA
ncbi:TRAM domain-containing protein, partial [Candidatus Woesearchaeota archaeon]|nr:TRAM domain-containing protein [Candidatus Woesearchaeota archaeon]